MDEEADTPAAGHFSLSAIQASEKAPSRRQKKRKLRKNKEEEAGLRQDEFKVRGYLLISAGSFISTSDIACCQHLFLALVAYFISIPPRFF